LKYVQAIDAADTALAAQIWSDTPDASFINPLGEAHGWAQIKSEVYEKEMGGLFSERKLTPREIPVHVYGDTAWVEFFWHFEAQARKDGSKAVTEGRETQIYRKSPDRGRTLVHVHYSGAPVQRAAKNGAAQ